MKFPGFGMIFKGVFPSAASSLLSADTRGCRLPSELSQCSFGGSGRGAMPLVMPVGLPRPRRRGRTVPVSACSGSLHALARPGVGAAALQGEILSPGHARRVRARLGPWRLRCQGA